MGVEWAPAASLAVGDLIGGPKTIPGGEGNLTDDDAYFFGLYVAEGGGNPLSIVNTDERLIEWLRSYIERRFGYAPTVSTDPKRPHVKRVLFRKPTREFLGRLADTHAGDKFVPESVLMRSEERRVGKECRL